MTSPRTVLLEPVIVSPLTPAPALSPRTSMIGVLTHPGCVVPSMITASVIVGSAEVGAIV